ncbi:Class I peptide chain release factor [Beutenbergia cavernae DSM 12333]|uniref:Class I peptide chain release factor n=1 Tax=Beutenbergia cavernae (strain ATCC BAA-8 / DSM 12333 / CCUG 43141 / JCM 11478 / NBRC 16432 / NCIMB 13614 / HKI 0122) TaxID=471853 RepID=C5C6I3_BEUC1|nr:alternative ribosome rescue aminoacyl-tRNA hydrolase ArfB [Beutenbergia cavernae]ACQ80389.1 Class I peptide chain release factor [Beutenbergia cavernae DSM 12333]
MPAHARPGLRVTNALAIPEAELSWRFSRSSGPGGQGVNTADSRVELSWDVTASHVLTEVQRDRIVERLGRRMAGGVLTVVASEHRAQLRNRDAARSRLAALVADALAPPGPRRRATRPTRGSVARRIDAKKRRSGIKQMRRPPQD